MVTRETTASDSNRAVANKLGPGTSETGGGASRVYFPLPSTTALINGADHAPSRSPVPIDPWCAPSIWIRWDRFFGVYLCVTRGINRHQRSGI